MRNFHTNVESGNITLGEIDSFLDPGQVSWSLMSVVERPTQEPQNIQMAREFYNVLEGALDAFRMIGECPLFPASKAAFKSFKLNTIWSTGLNEFRLLPTSAGPLRSLNLDELDTLQHLGFLCQNQVFSCRVRQIKKENTELSSTQDVVSKVRITYR